LHLPEAKLLAAPETTLPLTGEVVVAIVVATAPCTPVATSTEYSRIKFKVIRRGQNFLLDFNKTKDRKTIPYIFLILGVEVGS
jgi:hypothetical protein